jgi:hypothetical protein
MTSTHPIGAAEAAIINNADLPSEGKGRKRKEKECLKRREK